ncbi:MAG: DUF4190 domain-containing protein [Chitinophagaceae bacterium]
MRKSFVLILFVFFCYGAKSASTPMVVAHLPSLTKPVDPLSYFSSLSIKEVQKIAGRKLKFKEKIAVKVLQWKIKKGFTRLPKEGTKDNRGNTAMILGIVALACLFIPYVVIASIPCAILAIIFGNQARKADPKDGKAKAGVIMGWVTLGLILLALILVIVLLASWSYGGWG